MISQLLIDLKSHGLIFVWKYTLTDKEFWKDLMN
jgi:hypothetical protein